MASTLNNNELQTKQDKNEFLGYCLDSGAARSVVGRAQYNALCRELGHNLRIETSMTMLWFGHSRFLSAAKFITRLRVQPDSFLDFQVEILNGDFSLLVGLEVMIKHEINLDLGRHELSDTTGLWSLPIFYLKGHAFVRDAVCQILFTRPSWRKYTFTSSTLLPASYTTY